MTWPSFPRPRLLFCSWTRPDSMSLPGRVGACLSALASPRFRLFHRLSLRGSGDQPRTVIVGEIGPGPLDHYKEAITKTDEEQQVNEQPGQPGEESGEMQLAQVSHRVRPPNGGEASFVEILKPLARLAGQGAHDLPRGKL